MHSLALPTYSGTIQVPLSEIVRLEAHGNYTFFILNDGRRLLFSKTIAVFEETLPSFFLRVHRSFILNTHYLDIPLKRGMNVVIMTDGTKITVSRRKKKQVRDALKAVKALPSKQVGRPKK